MTSGFAFRPVPRSFLRVIAVAVAVGLCLLAAGCGNSPGNPESPASSANENEPAAGQPASAPVEQGEPATRGEDVVLPLRIVDGATEGHLVLADPNGGEVYTLAVGDIPVLLDGEPAGTSALEDGMIADITFSGEVLETWPAMLSDVRSIAVYSRGTARNPGGTCYDLCGLYLQVLEDLWGEDDGLNAGIEYISVDLSAAPGELSNAEKAAIAWVFANRHGAQPLTMGYEALRDEGWLTPENEKDPSSLCYSSGLCHWENGLLFSISAREDAEVFHGLPVVRFDAQKWRSPLGAYLFFECSASWPEMGTWDSYTVGGMAIA